MQKFILKGAEYQSSLLYQEQVASGCAAAAEIKSHQSPPTLSSVLDYLSGGAQRLQQLKLQPAQIKHPAITQ